MYTNNTKRLLITMLVMFVFVFATDFLIHAVLLGKSYAASMELWRPESEMGTFYPVMVLGQLLGSVAFVMLYAKGFASGCFKCACIFGLIMGVVWQSTSIIYYSVMPLPGSMVATWIVSGLIQGVLMGIVAWAVYKRGPDADSAASEES